MAAPIMLSLLTTLPLFLLPPTALAPPTDEVPAPALVDPEFAAAVEAVRTADSEANNDPVGSIDGLKQAIEELERQPSMLAADPSALEVRMYARLNLARAYGLAGEDELAAEAMDEVIRTAGEDEVPAGDFGPVLDKLYVERKQALEALGEATLNVSCDRDCRVYIDERAGRVGSNSLLLGSYRVWIEASGGDHEALVEVVELSEAGTIVEVEYKTVVVKVPPPPPPPPPKRIMSRPTSVSLTLIGAATAAIGSAVLAVGVDARRREAGVIENDDAGREAIIGGAVVLGVGGAVMATGIVSLSIDEVRLGRAKGRQAMLTWTTRF